MLASFVEFMRDKKWHSPAATTLLAVSGGVDSVVMSALFGQAKLPFAIAHANFKLRGQESDEDEAFVRALAQQYGVAYYTHAFDVPTYARAHGLSTQMAARDLRYRWFEELCAAHHFVHFATAHHWNDSIETILLNLTKGTGIAGLHGIPLQNGRCIRPLLFAHRATIVQYAQDQGLAWREDNSNQKDAYQRNLIRNQVVPQLKAINPSLEVTMRQTIDRLSQVEAIFDAHVAAVRERIWQQQGTDYYMAVEDIQRQVWAPVVCFALLKPFGFSFAQVSQLLQQQPASGAVILSGSHQLCIDRRHWIVTPRTTTTNDRVYMLSDDMSALVTPHFVLRCHRVPREAYSLVPDLQVAALDSAMLRFPLQVRRWRPGDDFYPLGMRGRKKVSDFLIDTKVPRPHKERVYVVTSDSQIVWVVGHRLDDRFKVTPSTMQLVVLQKDDVPPSQVTLIDADTI